MAASGAMGEAERRLASAKAATDRAKGSRNQPRWPVGEVRGGEYGGERGGEHPTQQPARLQQSQARLHGGSGEWRRSAEQ